MSLLTGSINIFYFSPFHYYINYILFQFIFVSSSHVLSPPLISHLLSLFLTSPSRAAGWSGRLAQERRRQLLRVAPAANPAARPLGASMATVATGGRSGGTTLRRGGFMAPSPQRDDGGSGKLW